MKSVVIWLHRLTSIIAVIFVGITIALAVVPFGIALFFMVISDELSGEWRRGREQTWLWRWAREHRRD